MMKNIPLMAVALATAVAWAIEQVAERFFKEAVLFDVLLILALSVGIVFGMRAILKLREQPLRPWVVSSALFVALVIGVSGWYVVTTAARIVRVGIDIGTFATPRFVVDVTPAAPVLGSRLTLQLLVNGDLPKPGVACRWVIKDLGWHPEDACRVTRQLGRGDVSRSEGRRAMAAIVYPSVEGHNFDPVTKPIEIKYVERVSIRLDRATVFDQSTVGIAARVNDAAPPPDYTCEWQADGVSQPSHACTGWQYSTPDTGGVEKVVVIRVRVLERGELVGEDETKLVIASRQASYQVFVVDASSRATMDQAWIDTRKSVAERVLAADAAGRQAAVIAFGSPLSKAPGCDHVYPISNFRSMATVDASLAALGPGADEAPLSRGVQLGVRTLAPVASRATIQLIVITRGLDTCGGDPSAHVDAFRQLPATMSSVLMDDRTLKLTIALARTPGEADMWRAEDGANAGDKVPQAIVLARSAGQLREILGAVSDLLDSDRRPSACARLLGQTKEDRMPFSEAVLERHCKAPN